MTVLRPALEGQFFGGTRMSLLDDPLAQALLADAEISAVQGRREQFTEVLLQVVFAEKMVTRLRPSLPLEVALVG